MTSSQISWLCRSISMVSIAVAVGTLAWVVIPVAMAAFGSDMDGRVASGRKGSVDGNQQAEVEDSRNEILTSTVWDRSLRQGFQPLNVRPKSPPPTRTQPRIHRSTTSPKQPDSGIRLVGTVLEDERSVAILTDKKGRLDFRLVGETFQLDPAGIQLQAIRDGEITVLFDGKPQVLKLGQDLQTGDQVSFPSVSIENTGHPTTQKPLERKSDDTSAPAQKQTPELPVKPMSIDEELDFLSGELDGEFDDF